VSDLILIVEDDEAIAAGLALNLQIDGYGSRVVQDGNAALDEVRRARPSLVLLDISLPGKSGLDVLAELRAAGDHTPVLVLSARRDEFDKVAALRLGADDYVTKPFALAELLARVAAVLRRSRAGGERPADEAPAAPGAPPAAASAAASASPPPPPPAAPVPVTESNLLRFADVIVDPDRRLVTRAAAEVRLTHLELELLLHFVKNPTKVFSREQLLHKVWGTSAGSRRTVDNFVAQLRAKLEADPDHPRHFVTVRGSGYRFDP
jgi:DNA-binding response OmpR family regulator